MIVVTELISFALPKSTSIHYYYLPGISTTSLVKQYNCFQNLKICRNKYKQILPVIKICILYISVVAQEMYSMVLCLPVYDTGGICSVRLITFMRLTK